MIKESLLLTSEFLINIFLEMENFDDLHIDYLISSSSYTTGTGIALLLSIKHEKVSRLLSTVITTANFYGRR